MDKKVGIYMGILLAFYLCVAILFLVATLNNDEIKLPVLLLFFAAFILIFAGSMAISIKYNRKPKQVVEKFSSYQSKQTWEAAALEYMSIHGRIHIEELTDEEKNGIYDYAAMPIIYLFTWLLDRQFMSREFYENHNLNTIEEIRSRRRSPLTFFGTDMGGTLNRSDVAENIYIRRFIDTYYKVSDNPPHAEQEQDSFFFDYCKAVCNINKHFYCLDFSWEVYEQLAGTIDVKYEKYVYIVNNGVI